MRRKGQSFIIGSLIFSLVVTLVFLSTGPEVISPESSTQEFFGQSLKESVNAFNDALAENKSSRYIRRRMQSYDRFVERQSITRGISYSSYSLITLPSEGEASFFQKFSGSLEVALRINGDWENRTVAPGQGFTTSFDPGTSSIYLELKERNESYGMDAANPLLVKHSLMESSGEKWENTLVG